MGGMHSQNLSGFIEETEPYINQLDSLSFDTAAELYDLFDEAAQAASVHIEKIDPGLRVELCDKMDIILDRIVDVLPPFEKIGGQLNKANHSALQASMFEKLSR